MLSSGLFPSNLALLQDEQIGRSIIYRATNPYQNVRARVQGLSLEATAGNCALELLSGEMFELLDPVHKAILTRCSKNPDTFPAADYALAPASGLNWPLFMRVIVTFVNMPALLNGSPSTKA